MIKVLAAIAIMLSVLGCAPLVVGAIAGAAVYHHECYRWVNGPYGPERVWVCRR